MLRGDDADLVQVAVREAAVQRVVLDVRAARRRVAAHPVANDDVHRDRQHGDHG
jgi:hypothetical protein